MRDTLPPELARRWGHLQFVKQVSSIEFHSECPQCGDAGHVGRDWPDRFFMRVDGSARGYCRRCGYQAFADDDKKDFSITPEMRSKWLAERFEREQAAKKRIEETLALLKREQLWLQYHNSLTAEAVAWWGSKGIDVDVMSYLKLGWCRSKTFWSDDQQFATPTATIPVFAPGWEIKNLRHRLIYPHADGDKYRPDMAGLPASLYYSNPSVELGAHPAIIVEGEIKSQVVCDRLSGYESPKYVVVGTPGKCFSFGILDGIIKASDKVWIVLDPDAKPQAWKLARYIGKKAAVVYLTTKADDFFTVYGGTRNDFEAALRYGRQA